MLLTVYQTSEAEGEIFRHIFQTCSIVVGSDMFKSLMAAMWTQWGSENWRNIKVVATASGDKNRNMAAAGICCQSQTWLEVQRIYGHVLTITFISGGKTETEKVYWSVRKTCGAQSTKRTDFLCNAMSISFDVDVTIFFVFSIVAN